MVRVGGLAPRSRSDHNRPVSSPGRRPRVMPRETSASSRLQGLARLGRKYASLLPEVLLLAMGGDPWDFLQRTG
jgi:hypothetical protein